MMYACSYAIIKNAQTTHYGLMRQSVVHKTIMRHHQCVAKQTIMILLPKKNICMIVWCTTMWLLAEKTVSTPPSLHTRFPCLRCRWIFKFLIFKKLWFFKVGSSEARCINISCLCFGSNLMIVFL